MSASSMSVAISGCVYLVLMRTVRTLCGRARCRSSSIDCVLISRIRWANFTVGNLLNHLRTLVAGSLGGGYSPTPMLTTRTFCRGVAERPGSIGDGVERGVVRDEAAVAHFDFVAAAGRYHLLHKERIGRARADHRVRDSAAEARLEGSLAGECLAGVGLEDDRAGHPPTASRQCRCRS